MPLDDLVDQSPLSQDWGLSRAKEWHLHFCLWPRTCYLTDKMIWLKWCYKGSYKIRQDMVFVFDDYYVEKVAFLLWNLRGKK